MSEQAADNAIRFTAVVYKVQTLVDGGVRLTLDLVDAKPDTILKLIQAKAPGIILELAALAMTIEKQQENNNNAIPERAERKSRWQTAEG
jgi:hypothetical protein